MISFVQIKNHSLEVLAPFYKPIEKQTLISTLSKVLLKMSWAEAQALNPNLSKKQELLWKGALRRLIQQEPLAYILNEAVFMGHSLYVDAHVLIPRPETEELVQWVLSDFNDKPHKIIDLCSGSGCIALAIKKAFTQSEIHALDVCSKALAVAQKNFQMHGVEIITHKADLLADVPMQKGKTYEIIISNPPYVREKEKMQMQENVLIYEPQKALFVPDDDPLCFYKKIICFAQRHLESHGVVYVEINQYLSKPCVALFEHFFGQVELKKDIFANDRMLKAQELKTEK